MIKELVEYFREDFKTAVLELFVCLSIFVGGFALYIFLALFI